MRSQIPVVTTSATSRGAASSARPAESTVSRRPCLSRSATATHKIRTVTAARTSEDRHKRRHHATRTPACPPTTAWSCGDANRGPRSSAVAARTWVCEASTGTPRLVPGRPAVGASLIAHYDQWQGQIGLPGPATLVRYGRTVRAITVIPGQQGSVAITDAPEPPPGDGPVLVETQAIGICGTDLEIINGDYGWAPAGQERLIIGHESLGRVAEAPPETGFAAGDLVVGIVRRPDPLPC